MKGNPLDNPTIAMYYCLGAVIIIALIAFLIRDRGFVLTRKAERINKRAARKRRRGNKG